MSWNKTAFDLAQLPSKNMFLMGFVLLIGLLSGCIPTRPLKKEEFLLYSQTIKGNKNISSEDLEVYYRQKPNRKILYLPVMPYLYAYYLGKKSYDKRLPADRERLDQVTKEFDKRIKGEELELRALTAPYRGLPLPKEVQKDTSRINQKISDLREKKSSKIANIRERIEEGNLLMRTVGEPPSIYNHAYTQFAQEQMQLYLRTKGYFDAQVVANVDTTGKLVNVQFAITENTPYRIRHVLLDVPDSGLAMHVQKAQSASELQTGQLFDEERIQAERNRLNRYLQDNGYFEFNPSYIQFQVNDTLPDHQLDITTVIRNPGRNHRHRQFYLNTIVFENDKDFTNRNIQRDTVFRDIYYVEGEDRYSKKVLDSKIFLRPDSSLYRVSDLEKTQVSLARLDMFRFVNIKIDTTGNLLNAFIFTSPYQKYQYSIEGGLNVSQSLPGPFVSFSFRNRNIFGGCEILDFRARAAIEAQAGVTQQQNFQSQEYGLNFSLTFPRLLVPLRSSFKKKLGLTTPTSLISTGYLYVNRPEYTRVNFQSSLNYRWQNRKNDVFSFSLLDLNIINTTRLDSLFSERLQELFARGSTLILSFDRSLVSSMNFSFQRATNLNDLNKKTSSYMRFYLESGGTTLNFLSDQSVLDNEKVYGLRYFQFLKSQLDLRFGIRPSKTSQVATRLNIGIARPYGLGSKVLPYEKFFFSGGSNSNRAWSARRLGPGTFTPDTLSDGQFDYRFEQPGEFLLEANLEYRKDLFGFVEGALFVDASNVWMIKEDPTRPGAKLTKDFWKEFAVGAGAGLRLDFDFLLVRFDLGLKMLDPARPKGERYIGDNIRFNRPLGEPGQFTFHLGIGYPF